MVDRRGFRFAAAAAALLCARAAAAQTHGASQASPRPMSAADVGEQRMRAGDCAGALDAFDADGARSPEIRRDRGICHEKLGQPYPAIDDYRVYLTQRPDAPDADAIRARVTALEVQVGIVKPGDRTSANGAAITTSIGGETDLAAPTGGSGGLETLERNEQLDSQADDSPLRHGKGFVLGLSLGLRNFGSSTLGLSELGGISVGYSFARFNLVWAELSLGYVNGSGPSSSVSGPGILGGYEARIALNKRVDDAFLLQATFRYESLSQSGVTISVLEPEVHAGYRHVFGPAFGLEFLVDAGDASFSVNGFPGSSSTSLFGGHVALILGF